MKEMPVANLAPYSNINEQVQQIKKKANRAAELIISLRVLPHDP